MHNIVYRRESCRACESRDLQLIFSLKPSPIGDAYVASDRVDVVQPTYPIDLYMCNSCGLAQIIDVIDPEVLYGEYIYVTASSVGLNEHFQEYASSVIERCMLKSESLVVDIGSNDGTLLKYFKQKGMKVLGVEPATHIASDANSRGIETINEYFGPSVADEIVKKYQRAKIITANNVFANVDDLLVWVNGVDKLLDNDGVFVFESYYLVDVVNNMVFDFIYHEHLSAFSVAPMRVLFQRYGLELVSVERVSTKGGSLRYFVQRPAGPMIKDGTVEKALALENDMGLYRKSTFDIFYRKIDSLKEQLKEFLFKAKAEGKMISGFGASITVTTLIYHFEIGEYLDYLVDDNVDKQGRFSPGLHLPVYPTSVLYERKPDCVVLLAWRFSKHFMSNHKGLKDCDFVIPVPNFEVVHN